MIDDPVIALVWLAAFLFSVTLHEAGHAWAAKLGGDSTAYEGGQVSLDPIPHMRREPFGMLVLPCLSLVIAGWPIGFASAPYDPAWADRHPRRAAWMAAAGPGANLFVVLACAAAVWGGIAIEGFAAPASATYEHIVDAIGGGAWEAAATMLSVLFSLNLILLVFNLLPLPPLDGASVLALFLPDETARRVRELASNPVFGVLGLLLAWVLFRAVFHPMFGLSLNLLYPGSDYR